MKQRKTRRTQPKRIKFPTRPGVPNAAEKFSCSCALPDVDGIYTLLHNLISLTRKDATRGDAEAAAWLADLENSAHEVQRITHVTKGPDMESTPSEIIHNIAQTGADRARAAATHVWPRSRATPPPAAPPAAPLDTLVTTAAPPATVTHDHTINPDLNVIDVEPTLISETVAAPVAAPPRGTIESKILAAMNQQAGRWLSVADLVLLTNVRRAALSKALTRLTERRGDLVQRVTDGSQSFRYRLLNSLPTTRKVK